MLGGMKMLKRNELQNRILAKIRLGLKLTEQEKLIYIFMIKGN